MTGRPHTHTHSPHTGVWGIILPMAMPSPATKTDREVLAGIVERVIFHNAETGFCVLRVKARGHRDLATIVGHAATISAWEWITASGDWVNDRTHGQQLKARFMRTSAPSSVEGIELDTLVPAYAVTIHKSQGSEYPAVIIPVMTQHYTMLQRNLLYTGVTRGKRLVVLVGQRKAVAIAVRNVSGRRRWSKLKEWLGATLIAAPSPIT